MKYYKENTFLVSNEFKIIFCKSDNNKTIIFTVVYFVEGLISKKEVNPLYPFYLWVLTLRTQIFTHGKIMRNKYNGVTKGHPSEVKCEGTYYTLYF